MVKIIKKIAIVLIIIIMLYSNTVFATSGLDDWITSAKEWTSGGRLTNFKSQSLYDDANRISGILWIIGLFAFLTVGVIVGIKIMFASSIEEKADAKKSMYPLLIGGGIVFGALSIWKLLLQIFGSII